MTDRLIDRATNDKRASLAQYGVAVFGIAAVVLVTLLMIANA
jgi:hypothetical protein